MTPRAAARLSEYAGGGVDTLLAALVANGRLVLVRTPPPRPRSHSTLVKGAPAKPAAPLPELPKTDHWIEIELLDDLNVPVANERYRVLLPDGSTREGRLNALGRARLDDIEPGVCQVTFPDIDAAEWGRL